MSSIDTARGVQSADDSPGEYVREGDRFIGKFARGVFRAKKFLAIAWPALALYMALSVSGLSAASFEVGAIMDTPIDSTRSAVTLAVMKQHYGNILGRKYEMVRIQCVERCESAANIISRGIVEQLAQAIKRFENEHKGVILLIHSYFTYELLPDMENPMIAHDRQGILLQWEWDITDDVKAASCDFVREFSMLIDGINTYQATSGTGRFHVEATGPTFLKVALHEAVMQYLPAHVLCTLPITLGILALRLRHIGVKMIIVPLVSIGVSFYIGFGVTDYLMPEAVVCSQVPIMLVMMCTVLTLTNSLLTVTRFGKLRKAGCSLRESLERTIVEVGPMISLMALIHTVACASMLFLPETFRGFGIGSSVMVFICSGVQLTFVPALLALFPQLSAAPLSTETPSEMGGSYDESEAQPLTGLGPATDCDEAHTDDAAENATPSSRALSRARPYMRGRWFRWGAFLLKPPMNMILPIAVCTLLGPLTYRCMTMRLGHAFELDIPRNRHEWSVAMDIHREFSPAVGCFLPIHVLATAVSPEVVNAPALTPEISAKIKADSSGQGPGDGAAPSWNPADPALASFDGNATEAFDDHWPADAEEPGAPPKGDFTPLRELLDGALELVDTELVPDGIISVEDLFPALYGVRSDFQPRFHQEVKNEKDVRRTLSGPFNAAGAPFAAAGTLRCVLRLPVLGDQPWHEVERYAFTRERGVRTLAVQTAGTLSLGFHGQISSESVYFFSQSTRKGPIRVRLLAKKPEGAFGGQAVDGMRKDVPKFIAFVQDFLKGAPKTSTHISLGHRITQILKHEAGEQGPPQRGGSLKMDVRTQEFFDANCHMADALIASTRGHPYALAPQNLESASFRTSPFETAVRCANYRLNSVARTGMAQQISYLKNVQARWDQSVSASNDAMLTFVFPDVDPYSSDAFALVHEIRATLAEETSRAEQTGEIPGLAYMTLSAAGVTMDIVEATWAQLPVAFLFCVLASILVIAVSFGAPIVPLVLFVTAVVPMTWAYGAATYVYQDGALAWTGIQSLMPTGEPAAGLCWLAPVYTLTTMLGLTMNCSVFFLTYVFEFREDGFGDSESIQLALAATNGIFTTALLIFAVSLSGLTLGSIPTSSQTGFVLAFSVILDMFVVRPVLAPATLSMCPATIYWPRVMPPPVHRWL